MLCIISIDIDSHGWYLPESLVCLLPVPVSYLPKVAAMMRYKKYTHVGDNNTGVKDAEPITKSCAVSIFELCVVSVWRR